MESKKISEKEIKSILAKRIQAIYDQKFDGELLDHLTDLVKEAKENYVPTSANKWTEKDTILITYGDSIVDLDDLPLETLRSFAKRYLSDVISIIHILPFFPYSSDDGFSVIDYRQVNPNLGTWKNIENLIPDFNIMADLVINHISQYSDWFQNYLKGENPGKDFFIDVDPSLDLSAVVRPRSLPLLTPVKTPEGEKHVWTTFSSDQIDLNFASPALLIEMAKVFLLYLLKGARVIRLDAIAFLWKEIGTNCLHLPQTHEVVKLMRDIMDIIHPSLVLLTETNVPNKENLSYFGEGDEANMVYQFSLPPLLLHALYTGNSKYLTKWALEIPELDENSTFFNFTASHDGIGVRPLEGLVPKEEFDKLVQGMHGLGAHISTKRNSDGSDSPYEMNITYLDALRANIKGYDDNHLQRFICSQTLMMTLQGVPAFYIHSLLGTRNYYEGVKRTGMPRTINRKKWSTNELYPLLKSSTPQRELFDELRRIIKIRRDTAAFHPNAKQEVIDFDERLFIVYRGENNNLLCIANVTDKPISIDIDNIPGEADYNYDLIAESPLVTTSDDLLLKPYQVMWLVDSK